MDAEAAFGCAIRVEIGTAQYSVLLEDDVLDHAAMALRHEEGVGRGAVGAAAHQAMINAVDDLGAGIS